MGIKYAHQLTHSISGLSLSHVDLIAQEIFKLKTTHNHHINHIQQPTLDVDISWLYRSKNKITQDNRLRCVINVCLEFVKFGFVVVLVWDGPISHHFKRASTERASQLYNNKLYFLDRINAISPKLSPF
jgi:hypothetical protein